MTASPPTFRRPSPCRRCSSRSPPPCSSRSSWWPERRRWPMLRAELSLRNDGFELDLALEVKPGACLALAGPSGCGKTTTLRAIAGLATPQQGRVACGGELWLDTAQRVNIAPEHRRCGYVFQDYALAETLAAADIPSVLVTHDFQEAALFGDEVAVLDAGRVVQRGSAAELAAAPASSFVADFSGAVVLLGTARAGSCAGTIVDLDGGGRVVSTARAAGRVAASVYPWEISLDPPDAVASGWLRNHPPASVRTITVVGGRVRIGLAASQPLTAEITEASLRELALRQGSPVLASWKAAATRLSPL